MTKMTFSDGLRKKLDTARVGQACDKAMKSTMKDVRDMSARKAPKKTGNLRRSHTYDTSYHGSNITGRLKNSADYWFWVNFGTSRMDPRHFLEDAVDQVNLTETFKKYFNENYKGGK